MLKIGHRGANGYAPENTLLSFQKAIDLQVDFIELDVHLNKDQEIIVIHDDTLDRTTDGKGLVNQFSLLELKKFRIEKTESIPTLVEVLELIHNKCQINIELKSLESAAKVVALIDKLVGQQKWQYSQFLISSFEWEALREVRQLNSDIPIGVLTEGDLEQALAFAKEIQAFSLHPDFNLLTKEKVARIQEQGYQVFPWTVNEPEDVLKIKSYRVNGIISDFPDRI